MFNFFQKKYADAEILDAIRNGSKEMNACVSQLYTANRKQVFSYILNNSGTSEDAQEILQIGITRLYEVILKNGFESRSSLGSYLYAICRNSWINKQKKAGRTSSLSLENPGEDHPEFTAPDPLHYIETRELRDQITDLLGTIGDKCKKLLLWSDAERRPMKWICEELGYNSVQSAMNRKSKCKRALKEHVRTTPRHQRLIEEVLGKECLSRLYS